MQLFFGFHLILKAVPFVKNLWNVQWVAITCFVSRQVAVDRIFAMSVVHPGMTADRIIIVIFKRAIVKKFNNLYYSAIIAIMRDMFLIKK